LPTVAPKAIAAKPQTTPAKAQAVVAAPAKVSTPKPQPAKSNWN
jgi:hypothetical protein